MRHLSSEHGSIKGKGRGKEITHRVNLGLAILHTKCKPGVPLTFDDIAAFTGTGPSAIRHIFNSAIRKLRRKGIGL